LNQQTEVLKPRRLVDKPNSNLDCADQGLARAPVVGDVLSVELFVLPGPF
jgi:hypothetical protein